MRRRIGTADWSFVRRTATRSFVVLVLAAAAIVAIWEWRFRVDAVEDPTPMPTPDEAVAASRLLERVAAVYKDAKTYKDSGIVDSEFTGDHPFSTTTTFKTAFVRPDAFRFEFAEDFGCTPTHEIIWTNAGPENVKVESSLDPDRGAESLKVEIARATGVSGGSAHNVPRLLMPDVLTGRKLTDATDARIMGDDVVDGEPCIRVHLRARGGPSDVWISERTFLVEKIVHRSSVAVSTTTYRAVVNGEVQPADLAFKP